MGPRLTVVWLVMVVSTSLVAFGAQAQPGWPGATGPDWPRGRADRVEVAGETPARPASRLTATPRLPILRGLPACAVCSAGLDEAWPRPATSALRLTATVPGQGALIVRIDPAAGTLSVEEQEGHPLTPAARAALGLAPHWLRNALARNLADLPAEDQDRHAALLLEAPDPRFLDELAFGLAHVAPEDLLREGFDPTLLLHNVRGIYELDPLLDYVRLVDVGVAGTDPDYHTTLIYTVAVDGVEQDWTLPPEDYYWWVVHPRLQDDDPGWIDPATGYPAEPPRGVFWRKYLWEGDPASVDYRQHFLLAYPNEVTEAELDGRGPSALGTFPAGDYPFPLRIVRDVRTEEPVLLELPWGAGRVVATTIPLEGDAVEHPLLANLVTYSNGNASLSSREDHVLVLTSRAADDPTLEPVLHRLNRSRLPYDLLGPAELAATDLTPYRKVLVPEGEGRALHEALVTARAQLEAWLATGKILELHAFDPADPWCGLVLPGGFTCRVAETEDLYLDGNPSLRELTEGVRVLWDGKPGGLAGHRWPRAGDTAVDRVASFAGQNMLDSVGQMAAKTMIRRSVQPAAIIRGHYGNCGEIQDAITAAGRTALIATINSSNGHEDHVWNEFRYLERWVQWSNDWSNGGTAVDQLGVSGSTRWGGGKENSFLLADRGDTWQYDRTGMYAKSFPFRVSLTDPAGRPVDGALVILFSESYYAEPDGSYPLMPGRWGFTDATGVFQTELGEHQNYYIFVTSRAGTYPEQLDPEHIKVQLILPADQTEVGQPRELARILPDEVVWPEAELLAEGAVPLDPERKLGVRLAVGEEVLRAAHFAYGTRFDEVMAEQGRVDLYLTDEAGLARFRNGEPFQALTWHTELTGLQTELPLPTTGTWFLLVGNRERLFLRQHLELALAILQPEGVGEGEGEGVGAEGEGEGPGNEGEPEGGEEGSGLEPEGAEQDHGASPAEGDAMPWCRVASRGANPAGGLWLAGCLLWLLWRRGAR